MAKHKKIKMRIKNPRKILILLTILIVVLVSIIIKNNSIKKKENISLIINNQDITKELNSEIIINENNVFLEFNDIKKCIDENIYLEDNKVITTSSKKVAILEFEKNEIEINGSKLQIKTRAYKTGEKIYLPISEMQNVYDIEFAYYPEYKNIVINNYSKKLEKAETKKKLFVKEQAKNSSANIEKIAKESKVFYVSEENGWAKIRTQNGNLGYIKKSNLTNFYTEREELQEETEPKEISYKKDITNKNLDKYENRKKVIDELLVNAVTDKQQAIKIIYKNEENESYKRFKLESKAILKECGITVVFE